MSLLLASNAFKLIDELNELSSMTMVDEFRLQRVYSDAQKLNELEDRYMITGIYYCLKNNPQLAFENLDAACKISQEFDVIDAYIKTSLKMNLEQKAYKKALLAVDHVFPIETAVGAIRVLCTCSDFKSASEVIERCSKAYSNQPDKIELLENNLHFDTDAIMKLANLDFDYASLSSITRSIMNYAFETLNCAMTEKSLEYIKDDNDVISSTMIFEGASKKTINAIDEFAINQLIDMEEHTNTLKYVFHIRSSIDFSHREQLSSNVN
jgi:hypothetical protein